MRPAVLALSLAVSFLAPALARAQECVGEALGTAAAPGDLRGYRSLFQQGGVTFYARVGEESPDSARLVIRNANRVPVELAFSVQLVAAEGPQGGVDLGRRCVRLAPGSYLAEVEGVTRFGSALGAVSGVRVRNLSLTLLGPGTEPAAGVAPPAEPPPDRVVVSPPAPAADAPAEPLPELPVTTTAVPDEIAPALGEVESRSAAGEVPAAGGAATGGSGPALDVPAEDAGSPPLSTREVMGWLSRAMRMAAALVLVLLGAGLALPILVALYAVLVLTPLALLSRLLRRSEEPHRAARSG